VRALLLSREAEPAAVAELDAAVADARGASAELLCCRRDCAPFWGHLSVTPVRRPGVPHLPPERRPAAPLRAGPHTARRVKQPAPPWRARRRSLSKPPLRRRPGASQDGPRGELHVSKR